MTTLRSPAAVAFAVVLVLVGGAGFLAGRSTAPRTSTTDAYFDGLRVGEAQGREEGRVLQLGSDLPRGQRSAVRAAFTSGYAAGANDVFAGYDGGWDVRHPWIVTVELGGGDVTYRIAGRTEVVPGRTYVLCPNGRTVCSRPR